MANNKIYIPTFISSIDYKPVRVLPHIYFYNGTLLTDNWYIENNNGGTVVYNKLDYFPYFDNYQGNLPSTGSRSLLFYNEPAVYGSTPTGSLYSEYWETYVDLLYNPKTRLFDCTAIIPLADYFKLNLNDIVEWRGNYYHLRAITDYNLSNGECNLQLLGPVLSDVISNILPGSCEFDFQIEDYNVWDLASCDGSTTFNGVVFNTTSSLSAGMVITWGAPDLFAGCYQIVSASTTTPDLTGSIVYSILNGCNDINCFTASCGYFSASAGGGTYGGTFCDGTSTGTLTSYNRPQAFPKFYARSGSYSGPTPVTYTQMAIPAPKTYLVQNTSSVNVYGQWQNGNGTFGYGTIASGTNSLICMLPNTFMNTATGASTASLHDLFAPCTGDDYLYMNMVKCGTSISSSIRISYSDYVGLYNPPTTGSVTKQDGICYTFTNFTNSGSVIKTITANDWSNNTQTDCNTCYVPTNCHILRNNTLTAWVGNYYDCQNSIWVYNATIYPNSTFCAADGSVTTITGGPLDIGITCNI